MVAPKKAALKEAEASYEEVMVGLRAKQAELKVGLLPLTCNTVLCSRAATTCASRHRSCNCSGHLPCKVVCCSMQASKHSAVGRL